MSKEVRLSDSNVVRVDPDDAVVLSLVEFKELLLNCVLRVPSISNEGHHLDQHAGMATVSPDMRYCSRSRRFHPDPGTKHISVPPRHMTKSYAPDFQHDITTLQIQRYNISYNRHTTALIQYISGRYMSGYILQSND